MPKTSRIPAAGQRGFTLAEVLVASAIFVLIMVAALLMYDRSNKVFKSGSEASDLQQNTRVAYDKLLADIRMTGFDYKRVGKITSFGPPPWQVGTYSVGVLVRPTTSNGSYYRCISGGDSHTSEPTWDPTPGATVTEGGISTVVWVQAGGIEYEQPDEQIEYAGTSAIVIRANYDYETDPARQNGREYNLTGSPSGPGTGLERPQFPVVTTGNDEIVGYALRSVDATANVDSITFYADVNANGAARRVAYPGGSAERLVTIPGVDLSNANPPYNLIRFHLANDGSVVATPIAENIRSLEFTYFEDTAGLQPLRDNQVPPALAPNVGGVGQYNPATPNALVDGRLIRGKIRSIGLRLVGQNSTVDPYWVDTTDTVAPGFRKYELSSVVVPRNLGMFGVRETDAKPPDPPTIDGICFGYCGIAVVNWSPAPTAATETYTVEYESTPSGAKGTFSAGVLTSLSVDLTQKPLDAQYTFVVRAHNAAGSTPSAASTAIFIQNTTTPNSPSALLASGGGGGSPAPVAGAIQLGWQGPTGNGAGTPSCTAGSPVYTYFPREIGGWRIFRDSDPNFTPDVATNMIVDETATIAPLSDGVGGWTYSDTTAPSCVDYYYRVQAVEYCAANVNFNNPADATLSLSPIFPANGTAAIRGQASPGPKPSPPLNLAVDVETIIDADTSSCPNNPAADGDICTVYLDWNTVTTDVIGDPKTITHYKLYRQKRQFGVAIGPPDVIDDLVMGTPPDETFMDLPVGADALGPFSYDYFVTAYDCQDSDPSNQVTFPIPCLANTIAASSAATGDGLTAVGAWVVTDADTFTISHATATLTSVRIDVYDSANVLVTTLGPVTSAPFTLAWPTGMNEGEIYRLLITAIDDTSPTACTETFTRFAQEEIPIPSCTLQVDDPNGTILTFIDSLNLQLVLTNTDSENLNLETVELTYTNPGRARLDGMTFPSGGKATVTTAVSTSGTVTIDLNPLPAGLIAADLIVPPNSSITTQVNWFKTANGSGSSITLANLDKVCVTYTRSSTGALVYACRLHNELGVDAGPNNPTSCD